jgi:hypothetical protein
MSGRCRPLTTLRSRLPWSEAVPAPKQVAALPILRSLVHATVDKSRISRDLAPESVHKQGITMRRSTMPSVSVTMVAVTTFLSGCNHPALTSSPADYVPLKQALCEIQDALAELDYRNRHPDRKLAVVPDEISVTLALTKAEGRNGSVQANLSPALAASIATGAGISAGGGSSASTQSVNTIKISFRHFLAMSNDSILGANIKNEQLIRNTGLVITRTRAKDLSENVVINPCK